MKAARRAGGRAFLIDTHRQATAAHADRVFLVRPGSDGALALGMLHLLVRENLVDRRTSRARRSGWAELEREVLPEHPPECTAAITGLSVEDVVCLAREYGTARAPFIRLGRRSVALRQRRPQHPGADLPADGGRAHGRRRAAAFLASTGTAVALRLRSFIRPDLLPGPTRDREHEPARARAERARRARG